MRADLIKKDEERKRQVRSGQRPEKSLTGRSAGCTLDKLPGGWNAGWSQPEKLQWEQSEALQHMHITGSMEQKSHMTGLDQSREKADSARKMREIFKAENSYGNIAVGVNKKHEAAVVVSEKREHNGRTVQENQKKVRMERKKKQITPFGNIYMNPDRQQDGAMAFQAKTGLLLPKMLKQIGRQHAESVSTMLEKRMPFLQREREKMRIRMLEQKQRDSREAGETVHEQLIGRRIEKIRSRMWKQEQEENQIRKSLQKAWLKAEKESADDLKVRYRGKKGDEPDMDEDTDRDEETDREEETGGKTEQKNEFLCRI